MMNKTTMFVIVLALLFSTSGWSMGPVVPLTQPIVDVNASGVPTFNASSVITLQLVLIHDTPRLPSIGLAIMAWIL